jgi:hypothetical protein
MTEWIVTLGNNYFIVYHPKTGRDRRRIYSKSGQWLQQLVFKEVMKLIIGVREAGSFVELQLVV